MSICVSKIPPYLCCGEGSIGKLKELVTKENARNVIVVTDENIRAAGLLEPVLQFIREAGADFHVFDDVAPEPTHQQVQQLVDRMEALQGDLIVAIGGGSVMDAAKLCAVLKGNALSVKALLEDPSKARKTLRSVMIPTTCGTGSEATCNSIVAIPEQGIKVGIVSDEMIPDYCLLDPTLLKTLPPSLIAATGVDALAHAVECYTSNKANPISDVYAQTSATLIFQNIVRAYQNPGDMEAMRNMMIGAFYGGAAITASGTTAVHALAYPLGGKFRIPHGVSNAILLAHVMEFNMDACLNRLAELCDAVEPNLASRPTEEKARYIIETIAAIVRETNIPTTLSEYGVTSDSLDFLTEAASKVTRLLNNNCKPLSLDDIRGIYRKVL